MKKFIFFQVILVFFMNPLSPAHAKQTLEFKDRSGKVVDRLKGDRITECRDNIYFVCDGKIKKGKGYGSYTDEYGDYQYGDYKYRRFECKKYRYYWADRYAREFKPLHKSSFQEAKCADPGINLFPAKRRGKWGVLQIEDYLVGKDYKLRIVTVIPFELDSVGYFTEGIGRIKKGGKLAFIDMKGNIISDFIFDEAKAFSNGIAEVKYKGKISFIDRAINIYDSYRSSGEGLIAVKKGGMWGYINNSGENIIDLTFQDAGSFSLGLAPVKHNGKWGYINKKGSFAIEPNFLWADVFNYKTKTARVHVYDIKEKRAKRHLIDTTGKHVDLHR